MERNKQVAWNVYLNNRKIDTVFYRENCDGGAKETAEDIKRSLVNHDGYDPRIQVFRSLREKHS